MSSGSVAMLGRQCGGKEENKDIKKKYLIPFLFCQDYFKFALKKAQKRMASLSAAHVQFSLKKQALPPHLPALRKDHCLPQRLCSTRIWDHPGWNS
jgi:hypothetical protein